VPEVMVRDRLIGRALCSRCLVFGRERRFYVRELPTAVEPSWTCLAMRTLQRSEVFL
jgi:hypothetical protein